MELLAKAGIIAAIVVIAVLIAALFVVQGQFTPPVTAQQAEQLVLSDLHAQDPNAIVNVITVSQSSLKTGSWEVVVTVVHNATRPCPELLLESFNYPAVTFVPSIYNQYTQASPTCSIYGLTSAPTYIISSPYVAIARSFTLSNQTIANYVDVYGYNNATVHAKFYPTLNKTATPLNETLYNLWLINYTATKADYSVIALLDQSGSLAGMYVLTKK